MIRLRYVCLMWPLFLVLYLLRFEISSSVHLRGYHYQSSDSFPLKEDILEMAMLSHLVYKMRGQTDCNAVGDVPILPSDVHCHFYKHDLVQGTQVLVLSNIQKRYVAVVFAGTDDVRTALADGNILLKPFGSSSSDDNTTALLPGHVHAGFDNAVFHHGLDGIILEIVSQQMKQQQQSDYRIFTTGHSLGAADAVLLAADIVLKQNNVKVTTINFGCPRIGNYDFAKAVNELANLKVWRFVLGWDLIPRLPEYPFHHVGHTIQMTGNETKVYYHHVGNYTLNYTGVKLGWGATPFVWVPGAMTSHRMINYLEHLQEDSTNLDLQRFETLDDAPIRDDDDFYINPPDDVIMMGDDMVLLTKEE